MINSNNNHNLKPFVEFIKSKKQISNVPILFEIHCGTLLLGPQQLVCSIVGNKLTYYDRQKNLSTSELDLIFKLIESFNEDGQFQYFPLTDIGIIDGNAFSLYIKWGNIDICLSGGNSYPEGVSALLDFFRKHTES